MSSGCERADAAGSERLQPMGAGRMPVAKRSHCCSEELIRGQRRRKYAYLAQLCQDIKISGLAIDLVSSSMELSLLTTTLRRPIA